MPKTPKPAPNSVLTEHVPAASPTARHGRETLQTDHPADLFARDLPAYAPSKLLRLR